MMFWYDHGAGGWGWFAMTVGMVLFWALVVTAGVLLFRALARTAPPGGEHTGRRGDRPPGGPTPEQILAERYARGEIEDEEYRRRLATLRSSHGGPEKP
ncbi:SHOCT domain-containing protein [Streptomyces sp. NPDC053427]|uniref:SHOCT domain-containing protein n=1 Tax=Streptomyces sp. NPDC053427 TaxID=3365701 RepID=UPI0037D77056